MDSGVKDTKNGAEVVLSRTLFWAALVFIGGYSNAYTVALRGGAMVTAQTGHMAKVGITLAQGNIEGFIASISPILACIAGIVTSESVYLLFERRSLAPKYGDYRCYLLFAEAAVMFCVGLMPLEINTLLPMAVLAYITGVQLCMFRVWADMPLSNTVCTGNLRQLSLYIVGAVAQPGGGKWARVMRYALVVFMFPAGTFIGTGLSTALLQYAIWVPAAVALGLGGALSRK